MPLLSDLDPYPPAATFPEHISNALRYRWRTRVDQRLGGVSEKRIRSFLLAHGVTHVLAEFGPIGCRVSLAARRSGARLFVHFHGYDATVLPRQASWMRQYSKLFAVADGIIAPSAYIANKLVDMGCPADKIHVSPCGVALDAFKPTERISGHVVMVGRMVEKKAPLHAIRAFAQASKNHPEAHLHVVGDGPLKPQAEVLLSENGLSERVTLHGARPHPFVRKLLSQASLFIQHSVRAADGDEEGLPVAILEAMASGIPVVATRHSGIPEAVIDGETGILVAEFDEVGMSIAINSMFDDPVRAAHLGIAGRRKASAEFSEDVVASRLRSIMGIE
ncbi:Glycosyltransferase involved in cell wall bisynthesis [Tropicimonas isoalkanivorans]|uniref:Glycosyltransferase involved in cell wall bisynthesis n=2 Tax=Tropicimonas isoalkanivorans TaxID=441112 RepID=A0A1I1DS33_9RHOB|nr:Glycosyltransferase involved in cell wall bisynthesis [Tropicimonas isoalkanivorans]